MSFTNSSSTIASTLNSIQRILTQSVYPIYLIFGLTGCFLNLIIFSRPKLRKTSCCIYFFAASTDHIVTLSIGIGTVLYGLNNPDPQTASLAFCKIRGYIFQITLMLSRWFVAFACIDRYASCSHKIVLRNFANPRNAAHIIVIILIVWSLLCIHRLVYYEIHAYMCGIFTNTAAAIYHSVYVIVGGGILPISIMAICASLITQNLQIKRRKQVNQMPYKARRSSIDRQVHNLLFIQIVFYIIFTIPQLCNLVFVAFSISVVNKSIDRLAIEKFINFIAEFFLYLFPVTSFYLYTLTSSTFRKELIDFCHFIPIVQKYFAIRIRPLESVATVTHHVENQTVSIQTQQKTMIK